MTEERAEATSLGFELTLDKIDVVIEDDTTGKRFQLRHTFRPPKDIEWLEYIRRNSAVKVRGDGALVDDQYLWEGRPVMQRSDWTQRIPAHHKYLAAQTLLAVRRKQIR